MEKGFSLIELVIVISIISIISVGTYLSVNNYRRYSSDLDMLMSENMVIALINDGKQYCREQEKSGYVLFDVARGEISFFCSSKKVDGLKLPGKIKIHSINTDQCKIDINKFGVASDAGTIILQDNRGTLSTITVAVGTGYAEVK